MELTLVPAYNRDYKTAAALKKDWEAGLDFRVETAISPDAGRYTSIRDIKRFPGTHVKIRYNKLRDSVSVSIKDGTMKDEDNEQVV